jgi:GNAT superfamily N-acetyltransferase
MHDPLDPDALLAAYDAQLRAVAPDPVPTGMTVEHDGPLLRITEVNGSGFLDYRDVSGLSSAELDALIARQRDFYAARGQEVEWKHWSHDLPADLPARLIAAGYQAQERETVLIGLAGQQAAMSMPDLDGVRLREVTDRADLVKIAEMESEVWGRDDSWRVDALEREQQAAPHLLSIVVAEHGDRVVSAGWIRYVPGTTFGGLWGGSTLAEYRGRGIYKALVRYRARQAAARGYQYLQVDASPDSCPILLRLGFVAVTTTTPYVWSPPKA